MKTVQFRNAAQRASPPVTAASPGDRTGGWRAHTVLGAPAVGGLSLPAAHPTASWLHAPRGVYLGQVDGQDVLVVADTGNHRVLIWFGIPQADEQPCDVVLGQPDPSSDGPAAGGRDVRRGMHLPTGVLVHDGMLVVADGWHHRVLVYRQVPRTDFAKPDLALGQPDLDSVEPNRGGDCAIDTLYWPFGVNVVAGRFYVADTGNRRVLGWSGGIPTSADVEPDLLLGQAKPSDRDENRGADVSRDSFRWPHAIAGTDDLLLIADAANHRMLGWAPHPSADRDADLLIGQSEFTSVTEWPYAPQRPDRLRFPYAHDVDGGRLAVADTSNNRILWWDRVPHPREGEVARVPDAVLGQPDFEANGENRWDAVAHDSLSWPYGISLRGDVLAVADSGNNRVVIWRRT